MVAIQTKYVCPTNFRGSRYKAFTTKDRKTLTVHADDRLGLEGNHQAVAVAYCKMMGWEGHLISGGTDNGNVFVFLPYDLEKAHSQCGPSQDIIHVGGKCEVCQPE